MTREISNYDDVIDSREIIERIDELIDALTVPDHDCPWNGSPMGAPFCAVCDEHPESVDEDDERELNTLKALDREGRDATSEWEDGATLIRDSYFQEYAQELAEECDLINPNAAWPATCIDWERAAWELRMDYTSVEFDGVTYWTR